MSKDHAIMLLGEAINITDNWEVHQEAGNSPLSQVCNLLREAKGNLEAAPVQVVVSDALADALAIDFRLAADMLTARSHVDGQRLLRGWNAMRAALVAAVGQK